MSSSLTKFESLPTLVRSRDGSFLYPHKDTASFVRSELDVSRLDEMIDRGLWLAGRVGNIRPLHRQRILGRRIIVTEQMDLHLLWRNGVIFLKPLPDWILDDDFVRKHIALDKGTLEAANGFLLSYSRLINYKSDFQIAKDEHLLPESLQWADWQKLGTMFTDLMRDLSAGKKQCCPRFRFGELRLSRINMIYRFHFAYRFRNLPRGYHYINESYQSFLRRNFTWLAAVFLYITVVLTAMQVGLGTSYLRDDGAFNRASYGFTVFSILLPLVALLSGCLVSLVLTVYHVHATRQHLRTALGQPLSPGSGKV